MTTPPQTASLDTPHLHPRWGGVAEELLHHTSRYYAYAESFLRHLAGDPDFSLAGYRAERLSPTMRRLMVGTLMKPPSPLAATDVVSIVNAARNGGIPTLHDDPLPRLAHLPADAPLLYDHLWHEHPLPEGTPAPDPFLTLCERLHIPVRLDGAHVMVPTRQIAAHLDGPEARIRENLIEAIAWLHDAGYRLRNDPGLTHEEVALRDGTDTAPPAPG